MKKSDMVVISVSAKQSDVGRDLYFFCPDKDLCEESWGEKE